jgi:capsular polysaccharide biosynthesis protein
MTDKKIVLFSETSVKNKLPINFSDKDISLFQNALTEKIPSSYYWSLKNAIILKDTVFRHFRFWQKYSHLTPLPFRSKVLRLALLIFPKKRIEKGVWITDNWSGGYSHWFADALMRLENVRINLSGHTVLLPAKLKQFEYTWRSLELLGYSYTFLDDKTPFSIDELILPSHAANSGNFIPTLINSVRENFLSGLKPIKPFRKIYISRQKAKRRRLLNEEQFIDKLKQYGFEVHCFEDYTFQQQLTLMNESIVVIGLHGAGLTNMLFMQAGTSVIELRKEDDTHNNCYFSLASALEIKYYYFKCEADDMNTQKANFKIPGSELNSLITTLAKGI